MLTEHEVTPYLQLAILLAKADGEIDGSELEFIDNARIAFGLTDNEIKTIEQTLNNGGCVTEISKMIQNPNSRLFVIRELAYLSFVDGDYSKPEKKFLSEVVTAFGLKDNFLDQCISWVQDSIALQLRGMKLIGQ